MLKNVVGRDGAGVGKLCGEEDKSGEAKWVGRGRGFGTKEGLWKPVSLRDQVSGSIWV